MCEGTSQKLGFVVQSVELQMFGAQSIGSVCICLCMSFLFAKVFRFESEWFGNGRMISTKAKTLFWPKKEESNRFLRYIQGSIEYRRPEGCSPRSGAAARGWLRLPYQYHLSFLGAASWVGFGVGLGLSLTGCCIFKGINSVSVLFEETDIFFYVDG